MSEAGGQGSARDLGVVQARDLMRSGHLRPSDLAAALLSVVIELEPRVQAWAHLDAACVRRNAVAADLDVAAGADQPLLGIPVGVKDNFLTAGVPSEAGSRVLAGNVPSSDAAVVARLKAAGAYVFGKTVCTEFATGDPPPTRNPWNLGHTPGGSSSGSAAAVAARMVPAAVGTQTGGSLLRPAAYTGIVGVKPTYGRVSRDGIIPVAWSLDTPGVMTRCVADADLLLGVMIGGRPEGKSESASPLAPPGGPPYVSCLASPGRPPKIGLIRYFLDVSTAAAREDALAAASRLQEAGAELEMVDVDFDFQLARRIQVAIDHAECSAYHRATFVERRRDYGADISARIIAGALISAVDYLDAQRIRGVMSAKLLELAATFDALLTPSTPAPAPAGTATGDPSFQSPWSLVGFPAITIPSGLSQGLPLGIQLVSRPMADETLLSIAAWCESALAFSAAPLLVGER